MGRDLKQERCLLMDDQVVWSWWRQACTVLCFPGMNGSEYSLHQCFVLAEHALNSTAARSPQSLFWALMRSPALRIYIRESDDENARRRVRKLQRRSAAPVAKRFFERKKRAYSPTM